MIVEAVVPKEGWINRGLNRLADIVDDFSTKEVIPRDVIMTAVLTGTIIGSLTICNEMSDFVKSHPNLIASIEQYYRGMFQETMLLVEKYPQIKGEFTILVERVALMREIMTEQAHSVIEIISKDAEIDLIISMTEKARLENLAMIKQEIQKLPELAKLWEFVESSKVSVNEVAMGLIGIYGVTRISQNVSVAIGNIVSSLPTDTIQVSTWFVPGVAKLLRRLAKRF